MADSIAKFLAKLPSAQVELLLSLVRRLTVRDYYGLDVKQLKGQQNMYRLRKGRVRIVFYQDESSFRLVSVSNRDDQTYRDF
jgi:mRNA-degrading endonuclease RelE of RelBE toxin-antitoxin system